MLFSAKRASDIRGLEPPCECAVLASERMEIGTVFRTWSVEFKTLEDLARFIEKHGNVILYRQDDGSISLVIYDDYVE